MPPPDHASALETFSKRAALLSLLSITALQLTLHPDITWGLRAIGVSAFCLGWILAGSRARGLSFWLLVAPLAPALAFFAAGRQGPEIDVLWMAGLTGSLLRTIAWSRWALPPRWSVLLGGWALALSLGWPVVVLREAGFDLHALRDINAINSWAMLPAPHVIAWSLYVVQAQLVGLCWFEWLHGQFTTHPDRLPRVAHALWLGITLASVVALVQGTLDIRFLNPEFWAALKRGTGTMLDANAYGTAAALAGPAGFLALRGARTRATAAGVLVLALNWAGVWVSGSRTAALCALFGAAGLAIGLWRAREDTPPRRRALPLVAAASAVSLVIIVTVAVGPLQRTDGPAVTADARGLASLWQRGGYGAIAMRMIREYPLTGVGPGAYRYLAPDYWRVMANDQLAPDNAQNWWRHQAAELGVLGGALVLLWSLAVAWHVIAGRARPAQALPAWTVRGLLAGIGLCSLLGMPTQNPVVLLWFFCLVAWLIATTETTRDLSPAPSVWIRRGWIATAVLAVSFAGGALALARGSLAVAERAERFRRPYVDGAYAAEQAPGVGQFRWTDDESRFILPVRGRSLVMHLWAHHPDIWQHPIVVTIDGPCGRLFEQEIGNQLAFSLGMAVPEDVGTIDAVIHVSRTWQPADHGGGDTRDLGVGVMADFENRPDAVTTQDYRMEWATCPASR